MKVYISGPMEGVKDYLDNFREAEETILKLGHDVVNPAKLDKAVKGIGLSREDYLDLDLELLKWCDAIVMLDGWQQSRGCNREYGYAVGTSMTIISYKLLVEMKEKQEQAAEAEMLSDQPSDQKPKARRQYINAEDKEAITELYKAGREMEEIAEALGLYLSAVSRYIKEAGLGDERYKGKAIPSTGSAPVTAAVYNGGTGKKGTKGN